MEPAHQLLTPKQAREYLNCSAATLIWRADHGLIPCFRDPNRPRSHRRYLKRDLDEFLSRWYTERNLR